MIDTEDMGSASSKISEGMSRQKRDYQIANLENSYAVPSENELKKVISVSLHLWKGNSVWCNFNCPSSSAIVF